MMAKVAIGLGILVIIVVSGVAGAGIYSWLDDEVDAQTVVEQDEDIDESLLTELIVKRLVLTHFLGSNLVACVADNRNQSAVYFGQDVWVALMGECAFVISDQDWQGNGAMKHLMENLANKRG